MVWNELDRPDFQRMIDDIEDGKINCVVTKDLSRLGRNYILTGQYTEIYFPSKGVRYIAVNDNVDTINGENELAPFLNILNEMHARQTSKKVKAAMRTRFANGAHYGAYAPLGYVKDPDKKGHLLIDPETRWIIEKIFDLAVHGRGAASITRILVEEKVPTPGWLNFQRYGTFANIYAGAPEEKAYAWTIAQVKSILKEETYIGHSVHNKQTNISFKTRRKYASQKRNGIVWRTPTKRLFPKMCSVSTGADLQQAQTAEERHNADIFRAGKMCGLRLVAGLWCEQSEQKSLCPLPL